jgi:hypothetical protein
MLRDDNQKYSIQKIQKLLPNSGIVASFIDTKRF